MFGCSRWCANTGVVMMVFMVWHVPYVYVECFCAYFSSEKCPFLWRLAFPNKWICKFIFMKPSMPLPWDLPGYT